MTGLAIATVATLVALGSGAAARLGRGLGERQRRDQELVQTLERDMHSGLTIASTELEGRIFRCWHDDECTDEDRYRWWAIWEYRARAQVGFRLVDGPKWEWSGRGSMRCLRATLVLEHDPGRDVRIISEDHSGRCVASGGRITRATDESNKRALRQELEQYFVRVYDARTAEARLRAFYTRLAGVMSRNFGVQVDIYLHFREPGTVTPVQPAALPGAA